MDRFLWSVVKKGLRRGILGNSPLWTLIGLSALAMRFLKRSRNQVVFSEKLALGEELVILHRPRGSDSTVASARGRIGFRKRQVPLAEQ
ncbi:MAG: hypothetical protein M0008_03560 [Actinomycetota bacterium]|jgi:hypothetical protein|nr:hypothetical protein [Actinomycetota bacterium]